MKPVSVAVALALSGLLLVPLGSAQQSEALPPSAGNNILYAHANEDFDYWMSTLMDEPEHAYDSPGYNQFGLVLGDEPGAYTWSIPLLPGIEEAVPLDPEGTIDITLYLTPTEDNAVGDVSAALTHGGSDVFAGEPQTVTMNGMTEITWSGAPAVEALEPGQDIRFNVRFQGAAAGLFMGMAEGSWTQIALPIPGTVPDHVPQVFYQDVSTPSFEADQSFQNATSDTYWFNWTSAYDAVDVAYAVTGHQNGSATFTIQDGEDATLLEADLSGDFNATELLDAAAPGNWTVTVEYTDFVGDFSLSIEEKRDAGPDASGNATAGGNTTAGGGTGSDADPGSDPDPANGTAGVDAAGDAGSEESPGAGLITVLAGLAAVAWVSRRRA